MKNGGMMRDRFTAASMGAILLSLAACADKPPSKTVAAPDEQPAGLSPYAGNGDISTLADQIRRCWATRSVASDLAIDVHLTIGRDGRVQTAEIVGAEGPGKSDPNYPEAAESVLRAARYPACQPFQLRDDLYDSWKDIVVRFKIPKRP
jgi:predicted small lipoprotein YifL